MAHAVLCSDLRRSRTAEGGVWYCHGKHGLRWPQQHHTAHRKPASHTIAPGSPGLVIGFSALHTHDDDKNTNFALKYLVCLVGNQHGVHEVVDDAVEPRAQPAARDDGAPHLRRVEVERRPWPWHDKNKQTSKTDKTDMQDRQTEIKNEPGNTRRTWCSFCKNNDESKNQKPPTATARHRRPRPSAFTSTGIAHRLSHYRDHLHSAARKEGREEIPSIRATF